MSSVAEPSNTVKRPGCTTIPDELIDDQTMPRGAKAVYLVLRRFANEEGESTPSIGAIARRLPDTTGQPASRWWVSEGLKWLVEHKLATAKRRKRKPTVYRLSVQNRTEIVEETVQNSTAEPSRAIVLALAEPLPTYTREETESDSEVVEAMCSDAPTGLDPTAHDNDKQPASLREAMNGVEQHQPSLPVSKPLEQQHPSPTQAASKSVKQSPLSEEEAELGIVYHNCTEYEYDQKLRALSAG